MSRWLERQWQRISALAVVLYPVSLVFRSIVALRRAAYRARLLPSHRLAVPVVVVGNITVGGTGKTPLVLWLAGWLKARGMTPGIVSRGYGGRSRGPRQVLPGGDPHELGDEPLLLAQRSGCVVWVGAHRASAARALLASHTRCDIVLSDDGLQHYSLERDVEIAVIDGARGLGNRMLLPAGPLREPASRLERVDAVVVNGRGTAPATSAPMYSMALAGEVFRNLIDRERVARAGDFAGQRVVAVAGIGNPVRFFEHLSGLGLRFEARIFPDHHAYTGRDFAVHADAVVMTEKDAVKCAALADDTFWVLPVDARLDDAFGEFVLQKLKQRERVNE